MTDKARLFWFRIFLSLAAMWVISTLLGYESDFNRVVFGRYTLRYFIPAAVLSLAAAAAAIFGWGKRAAEFVSGEADQKAKAIIIAAWLPAGFAVYAAVFMLKLPSIGLIWNRLYGPAFALATLAAICATLDALRVIVKKPEFWMVVFSVIVSLVLAEVGLRFMIRHFSEQNEKLALYDPAPIESFVLRYEPHHYESYIPTRGWESPDADDMINSLGFRGPEITVPKPEGVYRIAAIGGSTTYSTHVLNWTESYPARLEQVLREDYGYSNVEVINGGVGGHNSWETLINLAFRAMDTDPDLVIFYQNTNDVHARIVDPDKYRGDDSAFRRLWDQGLIDRTVNAWYVRVPSALWRFLGVTFEWFDAPQELGVSDVTGYPCTGHTADEDCLGMTPEEALEANPPIYYERNVRSIVGIAEANGVDVLLLTWASNPDVPNAGYAAREDYQAAYAEQNAVVEKVAGELGTYFFDFEGAMPMDLEYWSDGRHLTVEGNQYKAELIAAYIDEAGIIPGP